ncbi:hypothetical protein FDP51_14310 [Enterococcus mundtii]|nr:hypothetical protein [Enterococcus mundtii]MCA6775386.1 hypothetical protein [Enterococcus mundtii]MRI75122.1 hypothetical protein [Enterococcus mundtii]
MTFFPFVDPNRRPQAKIRKMTEELTQKFQAIDPDLTLIHNDNFIDYGPEVFPKLSKIYWDPRVPDHPMEHFVYSEYRLKYQFYTLYCFTPYGEQIDEHYGKVNHSDRKTLQAIDDLILTVIHTYQAKNLSYWKDLFPEEQFQQTIASHYQRTSQMIGEGKKSSRLITFTDPKHRPLAAVEKNTNFLETQLNQLDSRLTVTHDDSFIDFGPKDGHFLAECPYDPEEDDPDDDRLGLSDEEYVICYENTPLFGISPYGLSFGYHGDFFNGGIPMIDYLGIRKTHNETILKIIYTYKLYNMYYWREQYTPEDFQIKSKKFKKDWSLS